MYIYKVVKGDKCQVSAAWRAHGRVWGAEWLVVELACSQGLEAKGTLAYRG